MEPLYDFFRKVATQASAWALKYRELPLRQRLMRLSVVWVVVFFLLLRRSSRNKLSTEQSTSKTIRKIMWAPFSEFLSLVDEGKVTEAVFGDDDVIEYAVKSATEVASKTAETAAQGAVTAPVKEEVIHLTRRVPSHLMPLVSSLRAKNVKFGQITHTIGTSSKSEGSLLQNVLVILIPAAYIAMLGYVFYRFFGSDSLGSNNVGDRAGSGNKQKRVTKFEDVAGSREAREAVREVCDVLKNPEKYQKAGARLPSGILLVGPPGTGKTMLARAMANDAGLPFFYCSGSDFVEIYAGRGAARVRALFAKAEKAAPSVVFIDEIDALGGSRHVGPTNNEEREQTLNQLLSCMDGFDSDRRVVVMAATNRFDYLDKALVRPGRFDRIVRVDLPNAIGRAEILRVHTRDMILDVDVDLPTVAGECQGYSGAELASLANEAAIRAVRHGRDMVKMQDFMDALENFNESRSRKSKSKSPGSNGNNESWRSLFQRMGFDTQVSEEEEDIVEDQPQPQKSNASKAGGAKTNVPQQRPQAQQQSKRRPNVPPVEEVD